jgi:hypothetical protein
MSHGHDSEVLGQVEEPSSTYTHALEVLGQWQQLQSAIEQLKATTTNRHDPDPKLAA